MKPIEEIIESPIYWFTGIQLDLYRELTRYMKAAHLNRKQVAQQMNIPLSQVHLILRGDFDGSLQQYVEICLHMKKIPKISFIGFEDYLTEYHQEKP